MARFKYLVKDKEGKTLKGSIEADSSSNAVQSLRSQGLILVSLVEEKKGALSVNSFKPDFLRKKSVKMDDLVIFARQLATMVNAGIPLVNALDILGEQIEEPFFKEVVFKVRDGVETGSSLSEALARHPHVFSNLFVNMVRAGESSGMLDDILDRVALYLEKTSALRRKVRSALVYPAAVSVMALAITVFLLVKVIPIFEEIYAGFSGAELPTPTRILVNVSRAMRSYFYVVLGAGTALIFLIGRIIKTKKGRLKFDRIKLNLPVFGVLVRKVAVGKFTRTLSTLVKSGVPILSALEIVSKTADNLVVENAVEKVRSNVREGESIAEPLSRSGVFPPMVVRMISVGEQTGELEKMLSKIADFYDEQVDAAVSGLTSLIEPLIIAFLGIVVGGIVICMFLPILKLTTTMNM